MHDVLVSDTQSQKSDGQLGRGLIIQEGASAEVSRSAFINNRDSEHVLVTRTVSILLPEIYG